MDSIKGLFQSLGLAGFRRGSCSEKRLRSEYLVPVFLSEAMRPATCVPQKNVPATPKLAFLYDFLPLCSGQCFISLSLLSLE